MTSNGKQFTVTREMLTAVAGISARFSKFAFVLFCYITNHLMTGPLGNSEFCFPRISNKNKNHCSPRDQSLRVNYYLISINFFQLFLFLVVSLITSILNSLLFDTYSFHINKNHIYFYLLLFLQILVVISNPGFPSSNLRCHPVQTFV